MSMTRPQTAELAAIREIARLAHEVNRTYAAHLGQKHPPFDELPEQAQADTMNGVIHQMNHPENTPESNHKEWLDALLADGWVFGPLEDAGAKTHPCIMDYAFLPVPQKIKDHLFATVVNTLRPSFDAFCILHDMRSGMPELQIPMDLSQPAPTSLEEQLTEVLTDNLPLAETDS